MIGYHWNDDTKRWHDAKGEPCTNAGIIAKLDSLVALDRFLDIWTQSDLLADIGCHLSCIECNALATLLRHYDEPAAELLLNYHSLSDEDGDHPDHLQRKASFEQELNRAVNLNAPRP